MKIDEIQTNRHDDRKLRRRWCCVSNDIGEKIINRLLPGTNGRILNEMLNVREKVVKKYPSRIIECAGSLELWLPPPPLCILKYDDKDWYDLFFIIACRVSTSKAHKKFISCEETSMRSNWKVQRIEELKNFDSVVVSHLFFITFS